MPAEKAALNPGQHEWPRDRDDYVQGPASAQFSLSDNLALPDLTDDPDRLYFDRYIEQLRDARKETDGGRWKQGDVACEIETRYGERDLQKAAEAADISYGTLRRYRWVSIQFPESVRRRTLSFSHHEAVAARDDRLKWLARAEAGGWTKRQLLDELAAADDYQPKARELLLEGRSNPSKIAVNQAADVLRAAHREPDRFGDLVEKITRNGRATGARRELGRRETWHGLNEVPPPVGRYQTVVADPPWLYAARQDDESNCAASPYPMQTVPEIIETIRALDVLADDCFFWLWSTNLALGEGRHLQIFDALGLTFSGSIITWCKADKDGKPSLGVGERIRGASEHIILATRGRVTLGARDVPSWFTTPRGRHSEKPDEFYTLVETVSPGPWIDLYARRRRSGLWAVWGNEVGFIPAEQAAARPYASARSPQETMT